MQPPLPLPKPQQLQNQAPRMAEERHTARGRSALRRRGTCWSCRRRCARRLAAPTPHQHQPPPPMQHLLQSCIEASARWTVASGDPRPELPSSQRWTEAQAAGRWSASAVVPRHQRHTRASHPPFRALGVSQVKKHGPQPTQLAVPPTGAGHKTQTHTDLVRWRLTRRRARIQQPLWLLLPISAISR